MDAVMLNRVGIAIELAGTLLAAPEIIDRFVGIARLEDILNRSVARMRSFVDLLLEPDVRDADSDGTTDIAVNVTVVALTDYSLGYVALLLVSGNPAAHPEIGWWWPWRLLAGLPAAAMPAAVLATTLLMWWEEVAESARFNRVSRLILGALDLAFTHLLGMVGLVLYLCIIGLTTPPIVALSSALRRLRDGWLRRTLVTFGAPLFVAGVTMQFAATF